MAEGACLGKFVFDRLKEEDKRQGVVTVNVNELSKSSGVKRDWKDGCILAEGQNFAKELMETPGNLLSPEIFTEKVTEKFSKLSSLDVIVRYVFGCKYTRAFNVGHLPYYITLGNYLKQS